MTNGPPQPRRGRLSLALSVALRRTTRRLPLTLLAAAVGWQSAAALPVATTTSTDATLAATVASSSGTERATVSFAGWLLNRTLLESLLPDPLIKWGPVTDEGGAVVHGEVWVVVGRGSKAAYYHLTEEPATGKDSYAGYTVKLKGVTGFEVVNFGAGAHIPGVGNDTDGFVVTTTRYSVNPRFVDDPLAHSVALPGQDPGASTASMAPLLTTVQTINIPAALNGMRLLGYQLQAPDGTLLYELSRSESASAAGQIDCDAHAKAHAEGLAWMIDTQAELTSWVQSGVIQLVGAGAGAAYGGTVGLAAGLAAATYLADSWTGPIHGASAAIQKSVQVPVVEAGAKAGCQQVNAAVSVPVLTVEAIDLVNRFAFGSPELVCDAWGTRQVGSASSYDSPHEVTVSPVNEVVCVSWHVEWVE
jgi:hypothetical protein